MNSARCQPFRQAVRHLWWGMALLLPPLLFEGGGQPSCAQLMDSVVPSPPPSAGALGGGEDRRETIAKCLRDAASPEVETRRRAVLILGKYPDEPQALAALQAALADPVAELRRAAIVSLGENQGLPAESAAAMLPMIGDPDVQVRRLISSMLPQITLSLPMEMVAVNDTLRTFKRVFPPLAVAALRRAFADPDDTVRQNLIANEAMLRELVTGELVASLFVDPVAEIRALALAAGRRYLPTADFVRQTRHLVDDPSPSVRLQFAIILAETNSAEALPLLVDLSGDPEVNVAAQATAGLFYLQQPIAGAELLRLVNAPGLDTTLAAQLIASYPPTAPEIKTTLLSLLASDRPAYRAAALQAFTRLRGPFALTSSEALPLLADPAVDVRRRAQTILHQNRDLTERQLLELTRARHADVRQFALSAAAQLPPERAVELIGELILDDDLGVRSAAIGEYGRRRLPGWLGVLENSLQDERQAIRQAAVIALAGAQTAEARELLERFAARTDDADLKRLAQGILARPLPPPRPLPPAASPHQPLP